MSNLEPRAKIGDVVIVSKYYVQGCIEFGSSEFRVTNKYGPHGMFPDGYFESDQGNYDIHFDDKDILKNLTTNKTYES